MDSKNFLSLGCKNLPKLHLLYSVGLMSSSNHFCPALELKGGVWPVCMEDNPRAEQLRKNCFLEVVKGEGAFSSLYISKTTIYCLFFPPAPTFIHLVFIAHSNNNEGGSENAGYRKDTGKALQSVHYVSAALCNGEGRRKVLYPEKEIRRMLPALKQCTAESLGKAVRCCSIRWRMGKQVPLLRCG